MEHEGISHPEDLDIEDIKTIEEIKALYEASKARYEKKLETMRKEKIDYGVEIVRLEGEKKELIVRLEGERKERQVRYMLLEEIILTYGNEDAKTIYKIISKGTLDGAGTSGGDQSG